MRTFQSALYEGVVRHSRWSPTENSFSYRLFYTYLDLEEIEALFATDRRFATHPFAIASFRREDHHGLPGEPLQDAIRTLVDARLGFRPTGPIRLLTHLRYLGYGMNPVSFYYCFDTEEHLQAIVAEVNNTPWGEQHCYAFDCRGGATRGMHRFRFRKAFHVSPFNAMTQDYDWRFSEPGDDLRVAMTNSEDGAPFFTATMALERVEWSRSAATRMLLRHPLVPLKVVSAIYFQALKLWWKGTPYHEHPKHAMGRVVPSRSRTSAIEEVRP